MDGKASTGACGGYGLLPSKRGSAGSWGILLGVPALFLSAYIYPLIPYFSEIGLCSFRRLTGFACPGCGLKGSFIALACLDLRKSVDAHPLGVVVAGWLLYMMMREAMTLGLGRRPRGLLAGRQRDWLVYAFLFALMFNWVFGLML